MLLSLLLAVGLAAVPAASDATLTEARRSLEQNQPQEALSALEGLAAEGDVSAQAMSAEAHAALGQVDDALALLDTLDQTSVDVLIAKGRCQIAKADQLNAEGASGDDVSQWLFDAYDSFDRADQASEAEDLRALFQLGQMHLYRFAEVEPALEIADEGLAQVATNGDMLLLRGQAGLYVYYNAKTAGDAAAADAAFATAVADLQKAAANLPRHRIEPWGQLSWLHEDKGNATQAVAATIEILERQPVPSFDNVYRLAVRYSLERKWDASSQALQRLVSLSSLELTNRLRNEEEKDRIARELAWSIDPFVRRGDRGTALNVLRGIVRADPKAPEVWHNYAVMCDETGANDDAIAAYERLIELDPKNPRALNDLGSFLHHNLNRDLERAQELYRATIAMANEQLKAKDLKPEAAGELRTARDLAQNSLNELVPPEPEEALGGLLGDLLGGLSDAAGETEEDDGEAAEGEDAGAEGEG